MSTVNTVLSTNNMQITNYDVSKLAIGFNSFITATHTAPVGGSVLTGGMVLGRITATGKVVELDSAAVDGSQFPIGILVEDRTVAAGVSVDLNIVNRGRVAAEKVTLKAGVALTDDVDGRQLVDHLSQLVELVAGEELTAFDNQ